MKGEGNQQDYGMRVYDPRLGRFLSVDPITRAYPELTPYQFASNTPIWAIDIDGLEGGIPNPTQLIGGGTTESLSRLVNSPVGDDQKRGLIAQINSTQYGGTNLTVDDFKDLTWGRYLFTTFALSQVNRNTPGRLGMPNTRNVSATQPQTPKASIPRSSSTPKIEVPTASQTATSTSTSSTAANNSNPGAAAANTAGQTVNSVAPSRSNQPVQAYEVGEFNDLRRRSVVGDGLDNHHVPAKHPASQVIPGYDPETGPAVSLPRPQHKTIPTMKGTYNGTARSLLANDAFNLRRAGVPNTTVQQIIDMSIQKYPQALKKSE